MSTPPSSIWTTVVTIWIDHQRKPGAHVRPAILFLSVHKENESDAARHEREDQHRRVEVHAAMLPRALVYGLGCPTQVMRRVDQGDVRERLWKVADLPAVSRVVLLRQ